MFEVAAVPMLEKATVSKCVAVAVGEGVTAHLEGRWCTVGRSVAYLPKWSPSLALPVREKEKARCSLTLSFFLRAPRLKIF